MVTSLCPFPVALRYIGSPSVVKPGPTQSINQYVHSSLLRQTKVFSRGQGKMAYTNGHFVGKVFL